MTRAALYLVFLVASIFSPIMLIGLAVIATVDFMSEEDE